jgi:GNAT superfamily N-acetyltransferase
VLYTLTLGMRIVIPAVVFRMTRMAILEILPHDTSAPLGAGQSIRWAGSRDSRRLEAFGHKPEVLQRRFAAGARACILTEGETLLAYVWFHGPHHDEEDLGVRFFLAKGEIWLFDAMVRADQRGRGLYPTLLRAATRDLRREGVHRILIAIETANSNSLRAHQAAGARPIRAVSGLRLFGFTFVRHGCCFRAAWTGTAGYVGLPTSSFS